VKVPFLKRGSRDLFIIIPVIVVVVVLLGYVIAALAALATSGPSLLAVIGISALLVFAAIIALALFVSLFY
jgi:hypothetical protein